MSEETIRVLLLDDEKSLREPLAAYLRQTHGFLIDEAENGNKAVSLIEQSKGHYHVALVDQVLEEGPSGLEVIQHIKSKYSDIEVILFTGWGLKSTEEVRRIGAYNYIAKPFDKDQLALTIQNAAQQKRIRKAHDYTAALVKATHALTQTIQLEEQLDLVWDFMREELSAPTCFVALYDPATDTLRFPLSYDEGESVSLPDLTLGAEKLNWGLAGYVIKTGQELVWFTREQTEGEWQTTLEMKPRTSPKGPAESGICLPLRAGDKVLGALSVQSYEPHAFDEAQFNAVRALANQVAVTLEHSRLLSETEQKARKLEALQNLTVAINSTLELREVLTRTCRAAVELSGADHSGLVMFDADLAEGTVVAEYPESGRAFGRVIPVRGIPDEEKLILERQTLNIRDIANETSLGDVRDILLDLGIRSIVIVPVIIDGRVVASFSLDAIKQQRTFTQSEIEICRSLASHATVAIQNARLIDEEQKATRRMKKQAERLKVLYEVGKDMTSAQEAEPIWDSIAKHVIRLTGARRSLFVLVDTKGKQLLKAAGQGYPPEHLQSMTIEEVEAGVSGWVLRTKKPVMVENAQSDPRNTGRALDKARDFRTAPLIVAPLLIKGEAIGTLTAVNSIGDPAFDEDDKDLVVMLAAQAAIAYDNTRRMRELEQLKNAAEAMGREAEWKNVLQEIAKGAKHVLGGDCTLIWPYDAARGEKGMFFPEDLVGENIPDDLLEKFRKEEPHPGSTTERVLHDGYVPVEDLHSPQADFVGRKTRVFLEALKVKSFQGIRLDVAEEPLGVLFIDYKHVRGFGWEEQRILEYFANHAALTLKRARLYKQVRRSHDAARAIAKVNTLGNLDEMLYATVRGAQDVLGCNIATLYIFDEHSQRFVKAVGLGYLSEMNMRPPSKITPNSALWRIISLEEKNYHLSEDALNDELLKGEFVQAEGIRSALGIQLRSGDERFGVMFINYRSPHRFTYDEIQDALQFANQAAVAIRNAQLYERIKRQSETLEGLYEAGKALTSTLSLEETLDQISEQVLRIVGATWQQEGCFTHIALHERDKLRFVAACPRETLALLQKRFEIDLKSDHQIGVAGRCVKKGEAQKVDDVSKDSDYIQATERTLSQLSVPLKIGSEIIGVVSIEHPRLGAFAEEDVQNLELLAAQAAVAIKNAQQYEELETTKDILAARTALAWAGMVSSKWRHSIEKHAITIREQIGLLRDDLAKLPPSDVIDKRLEMVERLVNQILKKPLTAPLGTEGEVESVPVNDFVQERTHQLRLREPYKAITLELHLELEDSASVRANPEWLREALNILIDNAVDAMEELAERKIIISTTLFDLRVEISIRDNGRGIPPDVKERLFRESITKPEGAKGLGIGLLFAQMIVQIYRGEIWVKETGATGTTIVIAFPLEM